MKAVIKIKDEATIIAMIRIKDKVLVSTERKAYLISIDDIEKALKSKKAIVL